MSWPPPVDAAASLRGIVEAFQPLLGRRLKAMTWLATSADTPDLVSDSLPDAVSFSGGVQLVFEGNEPLFLTWTRRYPYLLRPGREADDWSPHVLDRVQALTRSPWGGLEDCRLVAADIFSGSPLSDAGRGVVGVRCALVADDGAPARLWIGVGGDDGLREGDDLWVGLVDPPNVAELEHLTRLDDG
ncbi:hypothetical protein ACO2Q3_22440 [Caulobacter sp. KR2-114]|uniref:hypothetical protein n=1 Tax=Caulobacter sp. KR2-114 TaxID=3400912 RepID=UPI003C10979B